MTEEQLRIIVMRALEATPRPLCHGRAWEFEVIGEQVDGHWDNDALTGRFAEANAELFCHAREDILALAEEIRKLQEEKDPDEDDYESVNEMLWGDGPGDDSDVGR